VISDPTVYGAGVPHAEFARLRQLAPLAWVEEVALWRHSETSGGRSVGGGAGYWAVTRHAAVSAVARRPEPFSSALRGAFMADPKSPYDLERTRQLLISMDAPEHAALRQLVNAAFTPAAVRALQAGIQAHAQALVARARAQGSFDVVADLAAELPLLVLADLLGMPREDRGLLLRWSNNLVGFDDPDFGGGSVDVYQQTYREAFSYATELARTRRRRPIGDLVSALVANEIDGRRLSDLEFCNLWLLLVVGGNESTRHFLSGSLLALDQWPDERRRLVAAPELTRSAVEELLRYVSPVMQFRRTAACDLEFEGAQLRAGDKVVLYFVSANRDERVFAEPERLDLARTPNPHVAFGLGPHFCLGAGLARVEGALLLDALRPHLESLRLTAPAVRLKSNFMNGIKSLPATFTE
jgi:hypothetical protein